MTHPIPDKSKWLWLLIPLVALFSLWLNHTHQSANPDEDDWTPVLTHLSKHAGPNDGVLVYPTWHRAPWAKLEAILQSNKHSGEFLHSDPLNQLDRVRHPQIWVLLARDTDAPESLQPCVPIAMEGKVGLCVWKRNGDGPVLDFLADLNKAKVRRKRASGKLIPCPWKKDRHKCRSPKSMYDIRARVGEVGNTRRKAIFAHPWPSKGLLSIAYPKSRIGTELIGHYGVDLRGVRMEKGSETLFRVFVGDTLAFEDSVDRADFEWKPFQVDLQPYGEEASIRFEISADDSQWRHFFVDGLTL